MVQVLPYVPTFLEQLLPQASRAAGQITQGIEQRRAMKGLEALLNPQAAESPDQPGQPGQQPSAAGVTDQGNLSPLNTVRTFKLAEKALGPEAAKTLINTITEREKIKEKEASQIRTEQRKEQAEEKKKFGEKKEAHSGVQKTFNVASSMLQKNLPGVGVSPGTALGVNREGVENRATFNNLKGKFESILLPLESKGALSKPRFDFIMSQVPKASDSQRVIAGKLRGLAETLSQEGFPIDTKILDSIPWAAEDLKKIGKEETQLEKVEAGTKINEDIARQLLQQAGNDKNKARELAKELGYEF